MFSSGSMLMLFMHIYVINPLSMVKLQPGRLIVRVARPILPFFSYYILNWCCFHFFSSTDIRPAIVTLTLWSACEAPTTPPKTWGQRLTIYWAVLVCVFQYAQWSLTVWDDICSATQCPGAEQVPKSEKCSGLLKIYGLNFKE